MLSGRTIMITGASSGIGAAAARLFAEEGAALVLMARRADVLADVAAPLTEAGARVAIAAGDVTRPADVERAVAMAVDTFGSLDGAFNNAGWGTGGTPLHELDEDMYDRVMDLNVRGVWNCLRRQIPVMLKSGTGGSIVNTSSTAGIVATGAVAPYVAAKHAVLGLTKAAAMEYGESGIRVNALVVGSTRTELMDELLADVPELEASFTARAIQKRMASPREVAQAAAWLCSDRSSFLTGAAMPVDGGWSAI
ncbi:glucose 1-dehydrogenase [Streptomyces sp. WAC05374]|nr:glucose 1-dehydrogenase [Streptomyces sp. WAC05374]TDF47421.1 glucose 1-dehydrogenase [Streptomyces sp. WAC05374]TDF57681.1 glucose 1-dehydrogenase [Streptomyces sp. WAC05374]TDF61786.1 glucose 1-dehydrogenase [Streptomyces sp. WAC05374]